MAMRVQFENSRKEFCSEEFLEGIKPIVENSDQAEDGEDEKQAKEGQKKVGAPAAKSKKSEKKKGLFGFLFKGK